ncbi:hypothetical protein Dimus_003715 [Dionaea muscipula]
MHRAPSAGSSADPTTTTTPTTTIICTTTRGHIGRHHLDNDIINNRDTGGGGMHGRRHNNNLDNDDDGTSPTKAIDERTCGRVHNFLRHRDARTGMRQSKTRRHELRGGKVLPTNTGAPKKTAAPPTMAPPQKAVAPPTMASPPYIDSSSDEESEPQEKRKEAAVQNDSSYEGRSLLERRLRRRAVVGTWRENREKEREREASTDMILISKAPLSTSAKKTSVDKSYRSSSTS